MNDVVLRSGVNIGVKLGAQSVAVKLGNQNVPVKINAIQVAAGASYSAEAQAVFAKMPNALTTTEKDNIATVIDAMVTSGNYNKIDYFFGFFLTDPDNALTSWFGTKIATNVNSATHSPGVGYSFDGSTNYIDSNINMSTDLTNAVQDDNYNGVYIHLNNDAGASNSPFGCIHTPSYGLTNIYTGATGHRYMSTAYGNIVYGGETNYSNKSRYSTYRTTASNVYLEKNGTTIDSGTFASLPQPPITTFIGCRSSSGTPSYFLKADLSYYIIGGGLDLTALNTELNTLQSLFSLN